MPGVRVRIFGALLAIAVASTCVPAQERNEPTPATWPRITVNIPDNLPADGVWIRYSLWGSGGGGGTIQNDGNRRQYVINAVVGGTPAEYSKIVVYVPGCEFKTFENNVGATDSAENFECVPLPRKVVHGFLQPSEIPSSIVTTEKKLAIAGEFDDSRLCDFLLARRLGSSLIIAGSCLGSPVPLGKVGELDPAKGGAFEVAIPDFASDQLFMVNRGAFPANADGLIHLSLRDKTVDRELGGIKVRDRPAWGLEVQTDYPDPVQFTRTTSN
jgi:hypothetical protein